ncbi:MAG: methyltransferase [Spirochaetes bacterium]|nr:MAG: methyltransferase [Spirochaetota bacterium]
MTSVERITTSIGHAQPDRIPIDFGAAPVTGIHVSIVSDLRDYFNLEKKKVKIVEPFQCLGEIEEDLQEALYVDVQPVIGRKNFFGFTNDEWKSWIMPDGLEVLVPGNFNTTGEDGKIYMYPEGDTSADPSAAMPEGGYFFDAIPRQEPIDEGSLDVEDNLEEFGEVAEVDLAYFAKASKLANETGRAVLANFGGTSLGDIACVPGVHIKQPKGIRDVTEWYMSLAMRQDYIYRIFEKQVDIALINLDKIWNRVGNSVDIAFICGTDFGTQTGTFCAPDTYRELWMPHYKRINNWIHKNTTWKTFKHSCGSVITFMELFIESGFDIINPVQCSATGMDPETLKKEFGKDIVFWGGGVDTQQTLPFGTPEEVRKEVLNRCEIFSKDGGFVFNTIHNTQARTPIENFASMLKAVKEFNGGYS